MLAKSRCAGWRAVVSAGNAEIMGSSGEGEETVRGKISMKKLFGRKNLKKDGTEGKVGPPWVLGGAPRGFSLLAGRGAGSGPPAGEWLHVGSD
jgi:hypothetical protein